MATLNRVVRDNEGHLHRPNESVIIVSPPQKRSDFDDRKLINVIFSSTNTKGAVFFEEIEE